MGNLVSPFIQSEPPSRSLASPSPVLHSPSREEIPTLRFIHSKPDGTSATYEVVQELGAGAFGRVYKVIHDEKEYALKRILCSETDLPENMKEVELLVQLEHPNIIKYHSSFILRGDSKYALCIIMEYVEGKNLHELFKCLSKPLPTELIMKMFIRLLEVLAYLQDKHIAHRDLKPSNVIFVTKDNDLSLVKLADFGVAQQLGETNATLKDAKGTIPWLAPEVLFSNVGKRTIKVDIWALGLILYEAVTLDDGFQKENFGWLGYLKSNPNILQKNVEDFALRELIKEMLQENPEQRPSARSLLDHSLIRGWKMALDPKAPERLECPSTTFELAPFIAVLNPQCSTELVSSALEYINTHLKNVTGFREAFINLKGVTKLCKFLKLQSGINLPENIKAKLLAMAAQSIASPDLANGELDSSSLTIGAKMGLLLHALIPKSRDTVIELLTLCVNLRPYHFAASIQMYCAGALPVFIEEFRKSPEKFHHLLSLLCRIPPLHQALQEEGLEYLVVAHLSNSLYSRYAMSVYEELRDTRDPLGMLTYLKLLLQRPPSRALSRLQDLLMTREPAHKLVTPKTLDIWTSALQLCLQAEDLDKSNWLDALVRLALPIQSLIRGMTNRGLCTQQVSTGVHQQPLLYCTTCCERVGKRIVICIACFNRCHKNHSFSTAFDLVREPCGCHKAVRCATSPPTMSPLVSISTNKDLLPVPQSYHNVPGCSVFPDRNQYRLRWEDADDYNPEPYTFYDKGFQVLLSRNNPETAQFYCEVTVNSLPKSSGSHSGLLAIGLSCRKNPTTTQGGILGRKEKEYAYCSDDGTFHNQTGKGMCGPQFGNGDVIGVGLTNSGCVFFTWNGFFLGYPTLSSTITDGSELYLAFCSYGKGMDVSICYAGPFVYDLLQDLDSSPPRPNVAALRAMWNINDNSSMVATDSPLGNVLARTLEFNHKAASSRSWLLFALELEFPEAAAALKRQLPALNMINELFPITFWNRAISSATSTAATLTPSLVAPTPSQVLVSPSSSATTSAFSKGSQPIQSFPTRPEDLIQILTSVINTGQFLPQASMGTLSSSHPTSSASPPSLSSDSVRTLQVLLEGMDDWTELVVSQQECSSLEQFKKVVRAHYSLGSIPLKIYKIPPRSSTHSASSKPILLTQDLSILHLPNECSLLIRKVTATFSSSSSSSSLSSSAASHRRLYPTSSRRSEKEEDDGRTF